MTIWLPIVMPYSALNVLVITLYSLMPSIPSVVPAADPGEPPKMLTIGAPSSRKLFEKMGAPLLLNLGPPVPALYRPFMARKLPRLQRRLSTTDLFGVAYGEIASSIYFALGIIAARDA